MTKEEAIQVITDEISLIKKQIYPQDMETTIWVYNRIEALNLALEALKIKQRENIINNGY